VKFKFAQEEEALGRVLKDPIRLLFELLGNFLAILFERNQDFRNYYVVKIFAFDCLLLLQLLKFAIYHFILLQSSRFLRFLHGSNFQVFIG